MFDKNRTLPIYYGICDFSDSSIRSNIENFICNFMKSGCKPMMKYFTINQMTSLPKNIEFRKIVVSSSITEMPCHRSLNIRVWFNNISSIKCLCPPSFYGDQCQY
jgi:hypothetical protein